jgi:nitrogen regulatory protein PII
VEADLLPKVRFEVVLEEERVESLVALLVERLSTGTVGDGRIFVSDVLQAIRIRTGERTT